MRYLGIDYGKKYIGLATSDGVVASAFKVISVSSLKDALSQVAPIIEKEQIGKVVVGVPESGEARSVTEKFIRGIRGIWGDQVKVEEVDETLTSKNATKLMLELGAGKKKRQLSHVTAACLILQQFLDNTRQDEER